MPLFSPTQFQGASPVSNPTMPTMLTPGQPGFKQPTQAAYQEYLKTLQPMLQSGELVRAPDYNEWAASLNAKPIPLSDAGANLLRGAPIQSGLPMLPGQVQAMQNRISGPALYGRGGSRNVFGFDPSTFQNKRISGPSLYGPGGSKNVFGFDPASFQKTKISGPSLYGPGGSRNVFGFDPSRFSRTLPTSSGLPKY